MSLVLQQAGYFLMAASITLLLTSHSSCLAASAALEHTSHVTSCAAEPLHDLGLIPMMVDQVFGSAHLEALAMLPQLRVLNLRQTHWAEEPPHLSVASMMKHLPRLRVFNAPTHVLVRVRAVLKVYSLACQTVGCVPSKLI